MVKGAGSDRNTEVAGKTIVIVGFGRIGRQFGEFAAALGMSVIAVDPFAEPATMPAHATLAPLAEALPSADVLVLVLPLNAETHHLIGVRELAVMRSIGLPRQRRSWGPGR